MEAFTSAGVPESKIKLMPNAYDESAPICSPPERPPPGRRYYNIGKWEPRKAQHTLIGAFLIAHAPSDDATLTMKTSRFGRWRGYPTGPHASVESWLKDDRVRARGWTRENVDDGLRIETRIFTDEQMGLLHHMNNIYVSAAHAEGWDYPAFDARCSGNRLVYIGYGGADDYASEDDVKVGYELRAALECYGWEPDAKWGVYDLEDLSSAMVLAWIPTTRRHPAEFPARFGIAATGERMKRNVLALTRATNPQIASRWPKTGSVTPPRR